MENMFCYQCQEAAKGTACTTNGVCGKQPETSANLDYLIWVSKGISIWSEIAREKGIEDVAVNNFIVDALFMSITNANFDKTAIYAKAEEGIKIRDNIKAICLQNSEEAIKGLHIAANYTPVKPEEIDFKEIGVLEEKNEDLRSLKELLIYGIKGMAAYAHHAKILGFEDTAIYAFMQKSLASTCKSDITADELTALVLECGKYAVDTMALLDKANTETYGNPELTEVNIGVKNNPGILISGHDLKDLESLLEQTKGTGVDVYTHSEMLPGHYYPKFKQYAHFVGNYGNAWWKQKEEFESFNGPILMTTNCIVPPSNTYINRIYTTGVVGFEGVKHITENNGTKDFSEIIAQAKNCAAPTSIETGSIVGGFAHHQVIQLADKVVDAVKSGAIKKFVVMAGCDGRMKSREYYTEFAEKLPKDNIILTAGCAKYRYNKLELGDIGGIPRVLDAGQCNDSYSLAIIALKLKEVFELNDINELPIVYNIAWYEQKAVTVLLALLHLGVKGIHLGPTLPAFLSPNVAQILIDNFGIGSITTAEEDIDTFIHEKELAEVN
jgi:hydroxylamine reductase